MQPILQLLAVPGTTEVLKTLAASSSTSSARSALEDHFGSHGIASPDDTVNELLKANVLEYYGDHIGISTFGVRTSLLVEALEGGDVDDVYRRLRQLDGQDDLYELVREGMTKTFMQTLVDRPGFGRLYVCSPWVNPSKREAACLRYGVQQAYRHGTPEILLITRRPDAAPAGAQNGLQAFRDVGARLFVHPRIHSKLYIREPDARGGYTLAIVGSQNLTRSGNIELGIRINGDTSLITQLVRYFFDIVALSEEET